MRHFIYTCGVCNRIFDNGYQFMAIAIPTCPECLDGSVKIKEGDRLPLNLTPNQIKKWIADNPKFGLVVDGDAMCLKVVAKGAI